MPTGCNIEGLTLTAASYVIFMEKEWAPGYVEKAKEGPSNGNQKSLTVNALATLSGQLGKGLSVGSDTIRKR